MLIGRNGLDGAVPIGDNRPAHSGLLDAVGQCDAIEMKMREKDRSFRGVFFECLQAFTGCKKTHKID